MHRAGDRAAAARVVDRDAAEDRVWMLLPLIVSELWEFPAGLVMTPPPRTPATVVLSVLFENVTLLVPLEDEPAENWK
jgi:hypothetical protein